MKKIIAIATLALASLPVYAMKPSQIVQALRQDDTYTQGLFVGTLDADDAVCMDSITTFATAMDSTADLIAAEIKKNPSENVDYTTYQEVILFRTIARGLYPCKGGR
jgi:hypothetical protein